MPSNRRTFLKTSLIAGAGATLPGLPAFASADPFDEQATQRAVGQMAHGPATGAFTRGIGAYPGAPDEFFGPTFVIDTNAYRNLALHRPATASSSYDYNLTAQLVTDGIKDTTAPRWIATGTGFEGVLPKQLRDSFLNHWPATGVEVRGAHATAFVQLGGGADGPEGVPEIDRVVVFVAISNRILPARLTFTVSVSDDGRTWQPAGHVTNPQIYDGSVTMPPDLNRGNNLFYPSIALDKPSRSRFYQVELSNADAVAGPGGEYSAPFRLGQVEFYRGNKRESIGGPYSFTSAWMSAGLDEEWVAVDLGAPCIFDRVTLSWIARAAEGSIQTSNDGEAWHTIKPLPASTSQVDDLHFTPPARARFVRVLMRRPTSPDGYILSEFEVFGRGGPVAKAAPAQQPTSDGRLNLAGGSWRVQRDSLVESPGVALSTAAFDDKEWVVATVPGTTLTSYLNAGVIPDPNYGQNQLHVSDSFFYADFWYRTSFTPPPAAAGKLQWIGFDGINWKAEVFLNGEALGRIDGGFKRARFDVTTKLKAGTANVLAVRVLKEDTPGSAKQKTFETTGLNGGAPGADNPTFHSSIGWDWIPTIRGRNTGIWGDVFLETTSAVTLDNPLVTSVVPNASSAEVTVAVEVANYGAAPVRGTLRGSFGSFPFQHPITIEPGAPKSFAIPAMRMKDPELWWPVGYGKPHLHTVDVVFETADQTVLARKSFKAGIRQMTSSEEGGNLRLFINGRRFIARGGNWGFAESMLRYRAREYDAAVRYHREMNFTMIRNWVGQVPDDAFFEACDRHGVVVWQDFWLANPWDGPVPNDNKLFLDNARDTILRIRQHASIGIYVGRNEGFPPPELDAGVRALIAELHPDIHYIGSSADGPVSGHGPYRALPPTYYFEHTDTKLHSEIGLPNIPTFESVKLMMPAAELWPQALSWGLHDFTIAGAQGGASFRSLIADGYGGANTAEEWITLAQFLNYEGYRAIFEAQSKYRMGVLLWMSHPCWPSFVWQTYDFYLEPTAAYFGCKSASEPIHIQWNRFTGFVEVVNLSAGALPGLTAKLEILNFNGSSAATQSANLDSPEDSVNACIQVAYPGGLTAVHFLRLTLTQGDKVLSTNFYLRGHEEGNYRAIRELPKVNLDVSTSVARKGSTWFLTSDVHNPSDSPALMVRLKAVRETARDRILPVIYSDNYINLMPGERRTITTEVQHADTRGQKPAMQVGGFNS